MCVSAVHYMYVHGWVILCVLHVYALHVCVLYVCGLHVCMGRVDYPAPIVHEQCSWLFLVSFLSPTCTFGLCSRVVFFPFPRA